MFNILRILSYNCHAQNKYDEVFSAAGRILQIRRPLRRPKFFRQISSDGKTFGGSGYSAAAIYIAIFMSLNNNIYNFIRKIGRKNRLNYV